MIWEGFEMSSFKIRKIRRLSVVRGRAFRSRTQWTEHDTAAERSDGGTRIGHMLAQVFNMRPPQRKVTWQYGSNYRKCFHPLCLRPGRASTMELGKDVPGPPLNDLTGSKGIVIVYRLRAVPKLRTEVSKSATAVHQERRERNQARKNGRGVEKMTEGWNIRTKKSILVPY